MKKKNIVLILLLLAICISGFVLFHNKIYVMNLVKNTKLKLNNVYTINEDATIIDVTYLEDNVNLDHEHIFKTMYDENKHWEECTICAERKNELIHSYIDNGWLYGTSCREDNVHKYSCRCGYSYTTNVGLPAHGTLTGSNFAENCRYIKCCSKCNQVMSTHDCYKSDGSRISCINLGTCAMCGYNYNYSNMAHYGDVPNINVGDEITNQAFYCRTCNVKLGTINYVRTIREANNIYNCELSVELENGSNCVGINDSDLLLGNHTVSKVKNLNNTTSFVVERKITYNEYLESGGMHLLGGNGSRSSGLRWALVIVYNFNKLDFTKPIISSITMGESEELTEWSKVKPIIVSGIENYCKSVNVKILDENENIVFEGKGSVDNPNDTSYQVSCVPELEVDTNGKTFTVIVTDSCGNSTSKEFKIAKVDAIPPTATSSDDITGEWSKSRKFTFKSTDYGVGEVSIAFNDIEDLRLAEFDGAEYLREYEFIGDVYKPKKLSVLYRDKLGNTSIQKITIDKLDNTAPTIVEANVHNNVLNIVSNDEHENLGEGSGVTKYRYIASSEKLEKPDFSDGIEANINEKIIINDIYKVRYIYVVAEDAVGNTSGVYEVEVPELILTSKVDLNLENGKGGVILDWSTYDISDKYFVIYRKAENAADWETIVNLDQKFIGNTYTDILANDKTKPNVSNINISGDVKDNNIKVQVSSNDIGTKYSYYIEAYDIKNIVGLLAISNKI